jgi:hypothetical protein
VIFAAAVGVTRRSDLPTSPTSPPTLEQPLAPTNVISQPCLMAGEKYDISYALIEPAADSIGIHAGEAFAQCDLVRNSYEIVV